jgi:hypothetical protein
VGSNPTTLTEMGAEPYHGASAPHHDSAQARAGSANRWWLVAALVVGYLLLVAWRLWLARSVPTPIAHTDEDRYLISARALAGGPGGTGNDTEAFRRMGYPLLLAPIYLFTHDPFKVYPAAQAVGAIINALAFPLAYLFGRRVLGVQSRPVALGLAAVAATLPAVAYYSQFTLTDVLFAPIGLGWLLLLHGWLAGRTPTGRVAAAIGSGAVVGYAFVAHVRGLIMLGIHVLVLAAVVFARRSRWRMALASLVAALLVTRLDWVTEHLLGDAMAYGGVEPDGQLLRRTTSAVGLVHTVCDAAGQIWYAGVGTWGLAAVGLVVAVARIRGSDREQDIVDVDAAQRVVLATALAATVCISFASAAALPPDDRVSNHAYLRYIAFLMPVWVLVGAFALIGASRARALRLLGMAAALMGATAFLVLSQMSERGGREWFHPFDTPEVSFLTATWTGLPVLRATVTALVILAALAFAMANQRGRWVAAAIATVLVINVVAMEVVDARSIRPMGVKEYATAPQLVRDIHLGPGDVVVSSREVALNAQLNHQREVYWGRVTVFDHRKNDPPANATAVVAPWHAPNNNSWDGEHLGWRRVAVDPVFNWAIWLRESDSRAAGR